MDPTIRKWLAYNPSIIPFVLEAEGLYQEPTRKYHDWKHAQLVVRGVLELSKIMRLTDSAQQTLVIAAAWHDAVYVPGYSLNELDSAKRLVSSNAFLRSSAGTKQCAVDASYLVSRTTIKDHTSSQVPENVLLQVLLDADLRSFSLEYSLFYRLQRWVRTELGLPSDEDTCKKHGVFLQQFLNVRTHIYHTNTARRLWEDKARSNIARWCEDHEVDNVLTT